MSNLHNTDERLQKSPKRRFLSIIAMALLLLCTVMGFLIIFWDKLPLENLGRFRTAFGVLIIVYGWLRFPRLIWRK